MLPVTVLLLGTALHAQVPSGDILLQDGSRIRDARIVAIEETTVSIVDSRGVRSLPTSSISLESLARARMAIDEQARERKALSEQVSKRQAEIDRERRQSNIHRQAIFNARRPDAGAQREIGVTIEKQLAELKARFPKKEKMAVGIVKSRTRGGSNIVGTTTRTVSGRSSTTVHREGRAYKSVPDDVIEVDVPHVDLHSHYVGWIRTATIQSLPQAIRNLENQLERDTPELNRQQQSISNQSASAQARMTLDWIQTKLRPYIAELKALSIREPAHPVR